MGTWELLLVLGIVLLLFGAKRLPGLASGLGGALRAFKKGATEPDELEEPKAPEAGKGPAAAAKDRKDRDE